MIDIKYELRFDKKEDNHTKIKKCYSMLIEKVLNEYEIRTQKPPETVVVYPIERLGHSGANVLYVNISNTKYQKIEKFIAKFDTREKIQIEVENALKFEQHIYHYYLDNNCNELDIGILLYEYIGKCDEFRDLFINHENNHNKCKQYLKHLYMDIELNQEKNSSNRLLYQDYIWYLDRKTKPNERIKVLLNYYSSSLNFNLINLFHNFLQDNDTLMVNTYLVHGDIHARNILANDRYSYLIDFAWVDNAHRMKDFTLLEVSIKHMLINETLKYSPHRERIYITQEEYMNFLALINNVFELADYQICSNDALIDKIFLKAFESIKIIREYAKKCLSQTFNSSFLNYEQEYFYSSFLVLYGMVGMNTIDENSLMLDLAQIAKKYKREYR